MRVIKSVETTDAILTYSNIPEDGHDQWEEGKVYVRGDTVI